MIEKVVMLMVLPINMQSQSDSLFLFTITLLLGMFSWVIVIVYYYQVWKEYYGRYFWITLGAGCMLVIPVFAYLNILYSEDVFLGTLFAFLSLVAYMLGALFFLKGGFGLNSDADEKKAAIEDKEREKGKKGSGSDRDT